jgi:predicted transcriptional regulator
MDIFSTYPQTLGEFDIDVYELKDDSPRAVQPTCTEIQLKPHQLSLLQKCIDLETKPIHLKSIKKLESYASDDDNAVTRFGIIGDRYGAGKSYVILSLIASPQVITDTNNVYSKTFGINQVTFNIVKPMNYINTNILVIPHNLTFQWEKYVKSFNPTMKYMVINKKTFNHVNNNRDEIKDCDLLIVTSTYYNTLANLINNMNVKVQRIFFDEVDSLNIPSCRMIDSRFYWFVTASYGNLLYPRGYSQWEHNVAKYIWYANGITNSGFIKNMMLELCSNVPRDVLKVLVVKNHEAFVEKSLMLPELFRHIVKSKTPVHINVLNGIVDKNILNFLNAGDIDGALQYINPNNKNNEDNIVSLMIDKYTKELQNLELKRSMVSQYIYENDNEREERLQRIMNKEKEVNNKIEMIKQRIHGNDMCSICFDDIETKTVTKCCQNSFCFKCIHLWINKKALCPMCKAKMLPQDLYVIDNKATSTCQEHGKCVDGEMDVDDTNTHESFDKFKNLKILLTKRAAGSKFLIFSNYDNTFTHIIPILNELGIHFESLKGNGSHINCTLTRYKTGNVDVLLVNSRNYGSGMNIDNTTDVIMLHKFDTEIEKQVIGRAHRLGRTTPLNVWYFLYENEINSHHTHTGPSTSAGPSTST